MDKAKIEEFLLLLDEIISGDAPWQVKKTQLLEVANENDRINLGEFVSWFDPDTDLEEIDPKEDT